MFAKSKSLVTGIGGAVRSKIFVIWHGNVSALFVETRRHEAHLVRAICIHCVKGKVLTVNSI